MSDAKYLGLTANKLARVASDLEDENAKLRELCKAWYKFSYELFDEFIGEPEANEEFMALEDRLREMGVEPY